MFTLGQDLKFGARLLLKDRTFALTALLTLAVCIGANAAMFSVIRSVLLKPLPFPGSDRIVLLNNSYPNAGAPRIGAGVPDYFDRLEAVKALDIQAVFRREGGTLGDAAGAERLQVLRATPSFYRLVQVQPAAGRVFTEEEGEPGKTQKVLLGYAFWQRKFAGRDVVGKTLLLNGTSLEIVGMLPRGFSFLQDDIDIFMPAAFAPAQKADDQRHSNNWQMVGRLAPGATLTQVQQQVDALNARNNDRFPEFRQILKDANFHTVATMLKDDVVRDVKKVLYLLWGGVLFVLLIGCANIANLAMVRASGRTREMATRHAIGGDISRLARQLVTESMLLAIVGGLLGILLAWWTIGSVSSLSLDQLPRGYEIRLDATSVGVALGLTVLVGVAIGLAPVLRLWRMNLNVELREESRGGTSSRRANLVRRGLATLQIAIALILLVGAGLMLASFRAVMHLDYGFQADGVTTANVALPGASYKDGPALIAFEHRLLESLRALPGIESVGITTGVPFSNNMNYNLVMAEGYVMKPGESLIAPMQLAVSAGYFESMRIPVMLGRSFDARDTATAAPAVIVDERLAKKFWPDQDPLGRHLYQPNDPKDIAKITPETRLWNVVGVVSNVQMIDPRADFTPVGTFYFAFEQQPPRQMTLTIRSRQGASVTNELRQAVARIDPQLPVFRVQPMQQWIDTALVGRRVPMLIAIAFGAVALFLSAIGIYGVLAYSVTQRHRELGVRMALGGSGSSVFGLVLGDGVKMLGVGLAAGLAGAYFVGRVMQSQLFNVAPTDPVVLTLVTAGLAVVALLASGIPAMRASRINPIVVLSK